MPAVSRTGLPDLMHLSEADLVGFFDSKILERGIRYFREGRLKQPMIYHDRIMADCQGTMPEDYHISVDLHEGNMVASCTCPYAFGYCKHIAAALYAWVVRPAIFKDLGRSENLLKQLNKDQVVEIVMDMIRYDPDVLYVINLRLTPVSDLPHFVKREATAIFRDDFVDYLNVREIVKRLDIFREYADDLTHSHNVDVALSVIEPVVDVVVANYTKLDDADGLMLNFFSSALDTLGNIIAAIRDDGRRRALMGHILDWYIDAEWGLEDVVRKSLTRVAQRIKENRYVITSAELKAADYRRSFLSESSGFSEEREYVDERIRRLNMLCADLSVSRSR